MTLTKSLPTAFTMTSNIIQLVDKVSTGMSDFQMRYFVVSEQLTPYRKIKQALLEIKARIENKVTIEFDIEELSLKIEIAERDKPEGLEGRLKEVEVKRLKYEHDRRSRMLRQVEEEILVFNTLVEEEMTKAGYTVDSFYGLLSSPSLLDEAEVEYWKARLSRSVQADVVNFGTVSKGTFEAVSALPEDVQNHIFSEGCFKGLAFSNSTRDNALLKLDV